MVGFNVRNLPSIKDFYRCDFCLLVLREPVQCLNCSHRQCRSCTDIHSTNTELQCQKCGETTSSDEVRLDRGCQRDMQNLTIDCNLCQWTGPLKSYQIHLDENHSNPKCSFCADQYKSVDQLNEHQLRRCEKVMIPCPLESFGCNAQFQRVYLNEHFLSEQHQRIIIEFISSMRFDGQKRKDFLHQLDVIQESIEGLAGGVTTLEADHQHLRTSLIDQQNKLINLNQMLSQLKENSDEKENRIVSMTSQQNQTKQEIIDLQRHFLYTQTLANNGTFLWKIENISQLIDEAKSNRQESIYSSPFYSSPYGYKMCLQFYPYGAHQCRASHMSLFFVLMRGDFDAILRFPFMHEIYFCLFDQTGQTNHHIRKCRPSIDSKSMQKPQTEKNIPLGIEDFLPLNQMTTKENSFVRHETMFIKVLIDFEDPKKSQALKNLTMNSAFSQ